MKVSTPKHTVWFIHKQCLNGFLLYRPYHKPFCESVWVLQISLSPNGAFHNMDQFSWLCSEEGNLIGLCCLKMITVKVTLKVPSPGSLINSSNEVLHLCKVWTLLPNCFLDMHNSIISCILDFLITVQDNFPKSCY